MPLSKLTIDPPLETSESDPTHGTEAVTNTANTDERAGYTSPVAPAFSPITPKTLPAFPAISSLPNEDATLLADDSWNANMQPPQPGAAIAPAAEYIPQPPPQPFSSEDSSDAAALRAAISSLQFQKRKAQNDIKALEGIRKKALDEPDLFKSELAAGRLKEQRPKIGDLQAILDATDSEDDEDEVMTESAPPTDSAPFERIPGPQNVVRMPYINWEKYHINGEALDRMHEQQRKWPGSFEYGQGRGREAAVAAPYSPWYDSIERQQDGRKDSLTTPGTAVTPVTSEHPMETRRSTKH